MVQITLAFLAMAAGAVNAAVSGFDVSHYQSSVDFAAAYKAGARFVMIKVCRFLSLDVYFVKQ
jgi:hypothetical protein